MDAARYFEWDDVKAEANVDKHGLRFEEAIAVFADADLADFDASNIEDGEQRRKAVGMIEGRLFTVVYTVRLGGFRLISARRSNAKETRCYDDR